MIRAIAIDDEPLALKIVESYCSRIPEVQLQKTFTSQDEARNYLENYPVDLLFLDIQMPNQDGISFYRQIPHHAAVIFTTAHDQYAVEGFNVEAMDYLLKPYSFERFRKALEKTIKYHGHAKQDEDAFLFLRADYQLHKINLADVLFFQSDDDYIRVFFSQSKSKIFRFTLKDLLTKLPAREFLRVHRSYVVRTDKVERVGQKTIFIGSHEIPVGANYEQNLENITRG